MIDIVVVLFSPKVAPSSLAVSGITSMIINEVSFGSYFVSSMMFIVSTVSRPEEDSNDTLDDTKSKSAATNTSKSI